MLLFIFGMSDLRWNESKEKRGGKEETPPLKWEEKRGKYGMNGGFTLFS